MIDQALNAREISSSWQKHFYFNIIAYEPIQEFETKV
jgi:hypothetical protein